MTHFGVLEAKSDGKSLSAVTGWHGDPDPRQIIHNVASSQHHPARIKLPAIRQGWLQRGPGGSGRGDEPFVEVSWDEALDLLSAELRRVYDTHGSSGVYGGSYGWSSAGRFHHGQSQLHRFLNCLGGYVSAVGDYSYGTSGALLPHVIGSVTEIMADATTWSVIREHTELFISFGGLSEKNSAVGPGGIARHSTRSEVERAREAGCHFVDITPIRDDAFAESGTEWIAPRPGSDAALMLAIAYVLDAEGLADLDFLETHTVGYDRFIAYVRGSSDGQPKSPEWASEITEISTDTIVALARRMAGSRTMINVSWSMQRQDHGEQPVWLGVTLAAMLGQIGLPGGGFQHGYGSSADVGLAKRVTSPPRFPQGTNPEKSYIPVARIADMLLHPGDVIPFNGRELTFPQVDLVYWVGGNPFHHHQDLARLRRAFQRPSTIVVHEQFWTSTARNADIVLPATMTIERDDFGAGRNDPLFFPMPALTEPAGEARDDYAIFGALEERLELNQAFTEGRTVKQWLEHLYSEWRERLASRGHTVPNFEDFWNSDHIEIPVLDPGQVLHADYRNDPVNHRLRTPSGRIEIYSEKIDSFGYEDCPGHPVWLEPREWRDQPYPLHLISNQPKTRLHSQLDVGATSKQGKLHGREPARMNPVDAAARELRNGDVVRIRNDRGSCLAGLIITDAIRPGVVQISTGAWYDPDPSDPSFCRHGNPNVLTADRPSSSLSQGTTAQHALVEVELWERAHPPITVDKPPKLIDNRT
ncbi:molybdopterin-dependent oxidoreductase [Saccharopolyspora mangrovi]|uniref:Molybdopterin-dependent oxidoreductase n=1 Tax=Saccharopolyspora mangrovi TaxID=3082379 RepID=A0ABU6AK78_9PSEU|nr:molybdopterin-dependent oxidoreductase [Saccharopolyspora sp. S2-29]MEB3371715.1 molybdopterin-dependent oxidoreductase [Saccharopolyspora sp. S2-29]